MVCTRLKWARKFHHFHPKKTRQTGPEYRSKQIKNNGQIGQDPSQLRQGTNRLRRRRRRVGRLRLCLHHRRHFTSKDEWRRQSSDKKTAVGPPTPTPTKYLLSKWFVPSSHVRGPCQVCRIQSHPYLMWPSDSCIKTRHALISN